MDKMIVKRGVRLGQWLAVCGVVVALEACQAPPVEAARMPGPDGRHDAVVLEGGVDATAPYNYTVCVVATGQPCDSASTVAEIDGATRSVEAFGVDVVWHSSSQLDVRYLSANKASLAHPTAAIARSVNVALKEGVSDPKAPPGAMKKGQ